ncbi:MAG: hypothetical protein R2813_07665 [Flavobacteriales bacterium]
MNSKCIFFLTLLFNVSSAFSNGDEHDPDVEIHTFENGETWKNCSFVIHPSLTQSQFHRFTKEAGDIVYFQPLTGASTLGKYNFSVGIAMSKTPIDQTSGAWNNTFAHPITDTTETPHYLGDQVNLPNVRTSFGITDHLDIGAYATKDPNANYGFYGVDLNYGQKINEKHDLYLAGRISHSRLFGPEDMKLNSTGADVLFSKKWLVFEPYAGLNLSYHHARETTNKVSLKNEDILSPRALLGTKVKYKFATAAVEYHISSLKTLAFKVGVEF